MYKSISLCFSLMLFSQTIFASGDLYGCKLTGQYMVDGCYMDFTGSEGRYVTVGGPEIPFHEEGMIGTPTLKLAQFGPSDLTLIFSIAGIGNYITGKTSLGAEVIGLSNGLGGSESNFTATCYKQ